MDLILLIERIAHHLGGVRYLALPLLRGLAISAGLVWIALAPADFPNWGATAVAMGAFAAYSCGLYALLWRRPRSVLYLHVPVLLVDLGFALLLIHLTGGARSILFLALLLIAGLQSYYYGMALGVLVAGGASAAYLAVVWPTLAEIEVANVAIRVAGLLGTAIVVGVLADVEARERLEVARLGQEVRAREAFIRNVVESLRDGLVVLDPEGRVIAWNPALETRYDVKADEALRRPFFEIFPNLKSEGLAGPVERLLRGEAEEFALLLGDPNALQQVVLNLLTNARDAMPGGGEIRLETGQIPDRPGRLRLVIADIGSGIPAEALPKIFDPFYTTKPGGTGLGLSVSYGIIRDHQGTVDVQSELGTGTTFVLSFPGLPRGVS